MCRASRASRVRRVEPVERVERVELCCSTSLTQPKCMGSTRRTCRVVSSRVESSQVEFGLKHYVVYQTPLHSDTKKLLINRIKSWQSLPVRLDSLIKLKCQTSTSILYLGIKYSMRDLITLSESRSCDMNQISSNDVRAPSSTTLP